MSLAANGGQFGRDFGRNRLGLDGYILSNVVVLPMTAWLSGGGSGAPLPIRLDHFVLDRFAFCGTSHGLGELVFWRILQGRAVRRCFRRRSPPSAKSS
jgi:hypothetical protein